MSSSSVDRAPELLRLVVLGTSDGDAEKPTRLTFVASSFFDRFERTGALSDLEEGIKHQRQALSLTPDGHEDEPARFNDLGHFLYSRFMRIGALSDLEEAVNSYRHAVVLTPDGHSDKPGRITNLGTCINTRFERIGSLDDLEEAIENQQLALSLTQEDDPEKPGRLSNLGSRFNRRFEHTGLLSDVEEAIKVHQQALSLTPDGRPNKYLWFNNLAKALHSRFRRVGVLADLEAAIRNQQQALSFTPDEHPQKPTLFSNLGTYFHNRFEHTGALGDLERAIGSHQKAIVFIREDDPRRPTMLNSLGSSLSSRFDRTGLLNDLDEAIKNEQEAVSLTPDGHLDEPKWLGNLGHSFHSRFKHTGVLGDLEDAIKNQQKAIWLTPDGHTDKPARHNNLANCLHSQFERTGMLSDLDKAIENQEQAVSLTPDGHPNKPMWLNNLGTFFSKKHDRTSSVDDLEKAISSHRSAATLNVSSPSIQAFAAGYWARLALFRAQDLLSALDAYGRAIDLIPQISWIGDPIATRHSQLRHYRLIEIPAEAAAVALSARMPDRALEWLEQGRSIVWNQIFSLRTSVSKLQEVHPDICGEFMQVSHDLQSATARSEQPAWEPSTLKENHLPMTLEEQTQSHHRLAEKWESLVGRIQSLPGFKAFLSPKKVSALKEAASMGPVVVINVHQFRCDALILEPGSEKVRHIPLDKLRCQDVEKMQKLLRKYLADPYMAERGNRAMVPVPLSHSCMPGLLKMLYLRVVHPILHGLGLTTQKTDPLNLPRIWWCPTGPLTFLPIHAAGYDTPGGREETSKYVVSSYIPTVNALLEAQTVKPRPFDGLLGVAMSNSPGLMALPSAEIELTKIQQFFVPDTKWSFNALRNEQATGDRVLTHMAKNSWIHLACHAVQDVQEPTQSGLCLHDRRLIVTDIVAKPFANADFAFLSACETATGDEETSDEAVHITGAMLGAGYRSVIGTMWAIPDEAAPIVAEKVYEVLLGGQEPPNSEQAARALHRGVKELRKSVHDSLYSWVPFVHYGV